MAQHKWHKEIKAWADGAEIEFYHSSYAKWVDAPYNPDWSGNIKYRIKPQQKCIVKGCENHTHEGKFIGDLCAPCWEYITNGKGIHSQAYRNAHPKEPQYLYVYKGQGYEYNFSTAFHESCTFGSIQSKYIGKIKMENDDA